MAAYDIQDFPSTMESGFANPKTEAVEFGVFTTVVTNTTTIVNPVYSLTIAARNPLAQSNKIPDVPRTLVEDRTTQRSLTQIVTFLQAVKNFLRGFTDPNPWLLLQYETGWESLSADAPPASYTLDPMGYVHVRGSCLRSSGSGQIIAVLPQTCRPSRELRFPVVSASSTALITVGTDGTLTLTGGTPATSVSLDGISFDTRA